MRRVKAIASSVERFLRACPRQCRNNLHIDSTYCQIQNCTKLYANTVCSGSSEAGSTEQMWLFTVTIECNAHLLNKSLNFFKAGVSNSNWLGAIAVTDIS